MIHDKLTLLTKSGTVILIASVVLHEIDQIDGSKIIFDEELEEGQTTEEEIGIDDYSDYTHSQKLMGFYQHEAVLVVIFLCKTYD